MGLFKTKEKDVIAYLKELSEDERAALMGKLDGGAEETEPDDSEEGEATPAETPVTESAPEGTDAAPTAAEGTDTPAEETEPTEGTPTEPTEAAQNAPMAEAATEPAQAEPAPTAAPGVSAEALAALDAKYAAQIGNYETRISQLESVINALKEKDASEKEGIGFQKAQSSQKAGQQSYEDVRKATLGF